MYSEQQEGLYTIYDTQGAIGSRYATYATPAEGEILGEIVSTGKNKM